MQENFIFQNILLTSSDTTTSTKQNQSQFFQMPFLLSGSMGFSFSKPKASPTSLWTNLQKENYSLFVCYFRGFFKGLTTEKLNWKIFKGMAKFIKTRNPQQCRSHHIKLTREFDGIEKFLSHTVKRIRYVKEKAFKSENQLAQIQEDFDLFQNENQLSPKERRQQFKITIEQSPQHPLQNYSAQQMVDKQNLMRTADSYPYEQNPVKSNGFFGNMLEFKTFSNIRTKQSRSSIPSFENHQQLQ